ncbi:MAG TPA: 6-bladed beta-propeller, partial [Longimicrobiales bacterium]|nr:6-bladed beta-propeller [Longimicrobiales bacterium]
MKNLIHCPAFGAIILAIVTATGARAQQVTHIPTTDRALAGTPVTQFSIGSEDGEDWELLSRVSDVAFDANDNLVVLDAGNNRVLVFDPNGKFLRKIGKKGGGPGELLSPVGLAITKEGFIAVTDLGRPGVSLFKANGTFVRNLMLGDTLGFPAPLNGTVAHPSGGVAVRANPIRVNNVRMGAGSAAPPTPAGLTAPRTSPILWLTSTGQTRTLYSVPLPAITPKVSDTGGRNRQVTFRVSQPGFAPPLLWSVLPNGSVAFADEAGYKVKVVSNGKVQRIIQRDYPVRKVTEHDKTKAREQRRKNMKSGVGMVRMTADVGGSGGGRTSVSSGGNGPGLPDAEIAEMLREMTFL